MLIIIIVPIITCVIWNRVNMKNNEKKIELLIVICKNLYSINWI